MIVTPAATVGGAPTANNSYSEVPQHTHDSSVSELYSHQQQSSSRHQQQLHQQPQLREANLQLMEGPDFITRLPGMIEAEKGDSVRFECKIAGNPKPTVKWMKNDVNLEVSENCDFEESGDSENGYIYAMIIKEVGTQDEGTYRCIAINDQGSTASITFLSVNDTKTAHFPQRRNRPLSIIMEAASSIDDDDGNYGGVQVVPGSGAAQQNTRESIKRLSDIITSDPLINRESDDSAHGLDTDAANLSGSDAEYNQLISKAQGFANIFSTRVEGTPHESLENLQDSGILLLQESGSESVDAVNSVIDSPPPGSSTTGFARDLEESLIETLRNGHEHQIGNDQDIRLGISDAPASAINSEPAAKNPMDAFPAKHDHSQDQQLQQREISPMRVVIDERIDAMAPVVPASPTSDYPLVLGATSISETGLLETDIDEAVTGAADEMDIFDDKLHGRHSPYFEHDDEQAIVSQYFTREESGIPCESLSSKISALEDEIPADTYDKHNIEPNHSITLQDAGKDEITVDEVVPVVSPSQRHNRLGPKMSLLQKAQSFSEEKFVELAQIVLSQEQLRALHKYQPDFRVLFVIAILCAFVGLAFDIAPYWFAFLVVWFLSVFHICSALI